MITKAIHFAPIPTIQFEMWYCPFPFVTWITTGSIRGIILLYITLAASTAIRYLFFRTYENQKINNEAAKNAKKYEEKSYG